jgi:serine/threonine-protein kinase
MRLCPTCGGEWSDQDQFCPRDGAPLKPAGIGDLVGTVLAERYAIKQKLGEGSMGVVYLGEHVRIGALRAIKVISPAMARNAEAVARFTREAANASHVNHPNVCIMHDFGETAEGLVYLAMEYIDGESLGDIIRREGPLLPHRAAEITKQIAAALGAAHHQNIVHRDLKPDNIMITRTPQGSEIAKVVDFGIAKAVGGEEGQSITRTDLVVGTPEYMSPEQLAGDVLDGRSDIYSLALVLYRMLTGRLPFEANSAQEVLLKRLADAPLSLNDAYPDARFPPSLQETMDRALQRMPNDRYATAEEFANDVFTAVTPMPRRRAADRLPRAAPVATDSPAIPPTRDTTRSAGKVAWRRVALAAGLVVAAAFAIVTIASQLTEIDDGSLEPRGSELASAEQETLQAAQLSDTGAGMSGGIDTAQPRPSVPAPPSRGSLTVEAGMALVDLMRRLSSANPDLTAIRDSALALYDATRLPDSTRADAAHIVADVLRQLGDRQGALEWAREAVRLAPNKDSHRILLESLGDAGD